jgi:hypothetical protein
MLGVVRWVAYTLAVTYIAIIGIAAIEELKARTNATTELQRRENEVLLALSNQSLAESRRASLENEQRTLARLHRRLDILIMDGASPVASTTQAGSLKGVLCEWAAEGDSRIVCIGGSAIASESVLARIALLPLSERSPSGSVLAVLIVTAAVGGALVRLSFGSESDRNALRTLLRAVGGGIACYLAIGGNNLLLSSTDIAKYSSPATASFAGFLSGMFSDRVFLLVSELVDALVSKIRPRSVSAAEAATAAPVEALNIVTDIAVNATPSCVEHPSSTGGA